MGITIAIIVLCIFVICELISIFGGPRVYSYKFEEKTVLATYLEEARRKLKNYRSQLIETNDPSVI